LLNVFHPLTETSMQTHTHLRTTFSVIAASLAFACTACTAMPDEPLASGTNNDVLVAQTTSTPQAPPSQPPIQTVKIEVDPTAELARAAAGEPMMTPWRHYVDGQLIVMYQDGHRSKAARAANEKMGVKVIQAFPTMRGALVALPEGMDVPEAVAKFQQMPGVIAVSPNAVASVPEGVAVKAMPGATPEAVALH
jgi:hypothetical protein